MCITVKAKRPARLTDGAGSKELFNTLWSICPKTMFFADTNVTQMETQGREGAQSSTSLATLLRT